MVFSSTIFILFFLPIFLATYFFAEKSKNTHVKNAVILLFSLVFYAWGGVKYLLLVIMLVLINYCFACMIGRYRRIAKGLMTICISVDIINLMYYKYIGFFFDNLLSLCKFFHFELEHTEAVSVILPIGISFYTFQIMSYVIDVYKQEVPVQKNFFRLLMYVIMFPQLIAGPIVRYKDINENIEGRTISLIDVQEGMKRFIIGFAKKIFLANATGNIADVVFAQYSTLNSPYLFAGIVCYSLQIYYDFSAYSDMAIGLGRIMGFHFNENFDNPYVSKSIKEFWRRWHISLSTWFRDYVYIPLGGNRKGKRRTYINLLIVFFLTGFWHGAAWQFIVWGLFHGLFLVIERLRFGDILKKLPSIVQHIYCLLIVGIGWIFFRSDTLTNAVEYIRRMFSFNFSNWRDWNLINAISPLGTICISLAIIGVLPFVYHRVKKSVEKNTIVCNAFYLVIYACTIVYMVGLDYNPFIYFKF